MSFDSTKHGLRTPEKARCDEEGERWFSILIQPIVKQHDGVIYSRLHHSWLCNTELGDLDIFISLPSGKNFATSVKSLIGSSPKVFYHSKKQGFCYRKQNGGIKKYPVEPTLGLVERVEWLAVNKQDFFGKTPIKILAFSHPIVLYCHEETPVKEIGDRSFVFINDVWCVDERQILTLLTKLIEEK